MPATGYHDKTQAASIANLMNRNPQKFEPDFIHDHPPNLRRVWYTVYRQKLFHVEIKSFRGVNIEPGTKPGKIAFLDCQINLDRRAEQPPTLIVTAVSKSFH